jgi:drug/metabolite transporter (DMT)-like permease
LGLALGLLGVTLFSGTFPASRAAVAAWDPFLVAAARATIAGVLALVVVCSLRLPRPTIADAKRLLATALGVVYGFPFLTTWALAHVSASHAGVIAALLPLTTAGAAAYLLGERPSRSFWMYATIGSLTVAAFALRQGGGSLHSADLALVAAMFLAAYGYTVGADVARRMGGWQTISWVLVLTLPFNSVLLLVFWPADGWAHAQPSAWAGLLYVAVISQYVGFFAWYAGLAMGGVARVGQIQLLQPLLTVVFAAWVLGETVDPTLWLFLAAVIVVVAAGRRA